MTNIKKPCPLKKKKLFYAILILIALLIVITDLVLYSTSLKQTGIGCGFSRFFKQNQTITDTDNKPTDKITDGNFTLETTYTQNSTWRYIVTGQLPNPCYSATVDALVAESYPEQVTILVKIIEPNKDIMCAQVISDFEYEGTFSASELATVTLKVE